MVKRLLTRPGKLYIDLVIRCGSFWLGVHYSERFQSYCIALIPCVVLRIGKTEYTKDCRAA